MKKTLLNRSHRTGLFCVLCVCALMIFCAFSGCTSGAAPENAALTRVSSTDVIIPVEDTSSITYTSSMQKGGTPTGIMEGLVIKDRNGKFDPALAESWNVSDDARTWTFNLAKNATWALV